MTFNQEICRAMRKIDRHVSNLMVVQEEIEAEYDSLFQSLLESADDFDEEALRSFEALGRLRIAKRLYHSTILALQYLRVCLWCLGDGGDGGVSPRRAIEELRRINAALDESSHEQVRKLAASIDGDFKETVGDLPTGPDAVRLAMACIDEDVGRILGEAMHICPRPSRTRRV